MGGGERAVCQPRAHLQLNGMGWIQGKMMGTLGGNGRWDPLYLVQLVLLMGLLRLVSAELVRVHPREQSHCQPLSASSQLCDIDYSVTVPDGNVAGTDQGINGELGSDETASEISFADVYPGRHNVAHQPGYLQYRQSRTWLSKYH
jgi:hypothetical protein